MQTTEFTGDVNTNNEIPSQEMLNNMAEISVLDRDGRSIPFKSIYTGPNVARRVLVIFIRHFFCGNCQEYLRTLTASITPATLLHLSTPTFIAVIGCGSPALIPMYQELTACPFPIYADPTKALYDSLGMLKTLNMGERPDYQRRGTLLGMVQSIGQGFKALKTGKALQAGDMQQVGGEFLFEPVDAATPMHSPSEETRQLGDAPEREGEEKRVTWCHRMRNTRDHAELPELREVLGLDGEGESGGDSKRWMKALRQRKGTGLSARSSGSVEGGRSARASSEKMMR
ncbi:AhpC/TSA antioxidant enzyme-domain-containing protein [Calycina marina]|uniref:AhpC/TSA antioxidant enzyme-domain-containing protein n=1 Tax=Calycina marina TaxID=1763456 RepID=A0A9P7YZL4_9HELO|nr:AhpC/TSA antioxidant enzyme-domain-containing protein [Calycina marina]